MASRGVAKLSISLPKDLARDVRRRVGSRGVSGFAARAMRHELERMQLGAFLTELDAELGPVPDDLLVEARRAWPKP
ncbi:MAG TPA: hypothetical protein VNO21_16390 [Polyangiaceae bacterium]|nr:hypothetical protein [Polyangiaceae bacterium]